MRHSAITVALLTSLSACKENGAGREDSSAAGAAAASASATPTVRSPSGEFGMVLPESWVGLYRVDSLSTPERGLARAGAINIVYLPKDTKATDKARMIRVP